VPINCWKWEVGNGKSPIFKVEFRKTSRGSVKLGHSRGGSDWPLGFDSLTVAGGPFTGRFLKDDPCKQPGNPDF
jgi:hypothetical protein